MHARTKSHCIRFIPLLVLLLVSFSFISFRYDDYLRNPLTLVDDNSNKNPNTMGKNRSAIERQTVVEPLIEAATEGIAKLAKTHDIAIPTPIAPWTDADTQSLGTSFGQSMEFKLLLTAEVPDFSILTYQQRVFKGLYQYFDPILAEGKIDVAHDPKYSKAWALYEKLEHIVYPWIRPHWPNMFHANNGTAGRGIVLCVGNHQFQHAATTIRGIREVLKSELPIEVFYIRDDDLSEGRRRYLETEFDNLKIVKAVDYINDFYTQFGGWAVKPYAILASSFSEVIMMDADAFFFQKPETLFDDEGYKATGTLFFYDRTLFANWDVGKRWLQSFLPTKSSLVEKTRWWQLRSAHEQESGVVVVNKKKSLLGLLATCKMNDKHERDEVTYKKMHGDKETFWIGYEMMQTPYAFVKSYGAVIGGLGDAGDKNNVCGNQLHLDAQGKPWWWNGGLLRDKHRWADRYLIFTHYAEGEDWHFETSCIKETDKIHAFTETDKGIATRYIALDQQRRKDEALIEQGTWEPSTH